MSQRSKLAAFGLAAAIIGSLITAHSKAGDRASQQTTTTTTLLRAYPSWNHWFGIAPAIGEVQVIPPGTAGVLHSFLTAGSVEIHEGPPGNITPPILKSAPTAYAQTVIDVRFTDGIKLQGINSNAEVTVLYSIDQQIDTGPQL